MSFEAEVGYNLDHEISFDNRETKKAGNLRMCTLCGSWFLVTSKDIYWEVIYLGISVQLLHAGIVKIISKAP